MAVNRTGYDDITIYMAGSIRGKRADEVLDFFEANTKFVVERLVDAGIKCKVFSPVRGKNCDRSTGIWSNKHTLKEIIARDETDVSKSDVIIIQTGDDPSDGTWFEFAYAYYVCKIPVVIVAPLRKAGEKVSWANEKATYIAATLEEATDWIIEYWMAA